MKTRHSTIAAAIALLICAAPATNAYAQTASASAEDLSVHISLLGVTTLDVTPQAPSQITDVSVASSDENSLPGVNVGGALVSLSTGLLSSSAEYAPGGVSASGATVTVTNLDLSAVSLLGAALISVSADAITSSSIVSGYCLPIPIQPKGLLDDFVFASDFDPGNLRTEPPGGGPGDGVTLGGLGISILGIAIPDLPLNPPPNTGIDLSALGIAGATLVLNEQTFGGDGVTSASKSSNALHLTLDVAGLITADVIVAHSDASLDCAP
jgi:hypothetical protein